MSEEHDAAVHSLCDMQMRAAVARAEKAEADLLHFMDGTLDYQPLVRERDDLRAKMTEVSFANVEAAARAKLREDEIDDLRAKLAAAEAKYSPTKGTQTQTQAERGPSWETIMRAEAAKKALAEEKAEQLKDAAEWRQAFAEQERRHVHHLQCLGERDAALALVDAAEKQRNEWIRSSLERKSKMEHLESELEAHKAGLADCALERDTAERLAKQNWAQLGVFESQCEGLRESLKAAIAPRCDVHDVTLDAALARVKELELEIADYKGCDSPETHDHLHKMYLASEARIAELEGALRETVDAIEALAPVAEGHFIGTVQWDAVDRARRVLEGK